MREKTENQNPEERAQQVQHFGDNDTDFVPSQNTVTLDEINADGVFGRDSQNSGLREIDYTE